MPNYYEENPLSSAGTRRTIQPRRSGLAGWMVKKGLAVDEHSATHTMIGIIIVCIVLIFIMLKISEKDDAVYTPDPEDDDVSLVVKHVA